MTLALTLLDGAPLRPGGQPMSVTRAQFELKEGVQAKRVNKKKLKELRQQQEQRALGWRGFDDSVRPFLPS